MVLSLLCGALSAAALIHALVPPGPRATDIVILPLSAQSPVPTTPPAFHGFFKRQNGPGQTVLVAPDNTCGYVSGQSDAAYTCVDKSALCVFITASGGGAAGCCGVSDCGFRIACLDYDQYHSSSLCDAQCSTDTLTQKCTNPSAPYCGTILFPNSATDYFCNSLRPTGAYTADTTYPGQRGRSLIQTVLAGETSVSRRPLVTVTATASASSTPSSSGSSMPVGAIVGGVVGGVAVLGLLGLGAFFLLKQRRKTKLTPVPGSVPGQESGQGQGGYPSGPPGSSPSPGLGPEGAGVGIKPGHQSMMSTYSAAPPYGTPTPPPGTGAGGYPAYTPPPQQQQQHPGQGGYYPAGAGGYGQQSAPYQQGGNMNMNMPIVHEAGGEMVQVQRPVEMEALEARRHELQ